jgi:hypothetical protein
MRQIRSLRTLNSIPGQILPENSLDNPLTAKSYDFLINHASETPARLVSAISGHTSSPPGDRLRQK